MTYQPLQAFSDGPNRRCARRLHAFASEKGSRPLRFEPLEARQMLSITPLGNMGVSESTGEKPQSKVWEHDGQWWSVMPVERRLVDLAAERHELDADFASLDQ